jgi:hypothetical protein
MRVSSIRWGVIFIGIGLFFLALNLELLDSLVFPRLFALWPVLLIAIGVELIFRHSRLYFLAFLSPIIIAGAFIAAATATGDWGWKADEFWSRWAWRVGEKKVDIAEIPSDSAARLLDLNLECGTSIVSFRPSSDLLFKATTDYYRRSPWTEHSFSDSTEKIQYTNREKSRLALFGINMDATQTNFQITDILPIKAAITSHGNEPEFDLTALNLNSLDLDIQSENTKLRLGALADSIGVKISGKTDELNITLPRESGLSVSGKTAELNTLLRNSGLSSRAGTYISNEYSTASHKIYLILNADIKSISINRD